MKNTQQWLNLTTNAKLNTVDTYRINPEKLPLWKEHQGENGVFLLQECPSLETGVNFSNAINNKYGYLKDIKTSPCKPSMFTLFQVLIDAVDEDDIEKEELAEDTVYKKELLEGCTLVEVGVHLNSKNLVVDSSLNKVDDVFKNSKSGYVISVNGGLKEVDKSEIFNVSRGSVTRWVAYNLSTSKVSPILFKSEDDVDDRLESAGEAWVKSQVVHKIESYITQEGQYSEVVI